MEPAIGLLELDSIAVGIRAGDAMVKQAPLDYCYAGTVQPGKYLVLVAGDTASVEEAIGVLRQQVEPVVRNELPADGDVMYTGAADKLEQALVNMSGSFVLAILILYLLMSALQWASSHTSRASFRPRARRDRASVSWSDGTAWRRGSAGF